MKNKKNNIWVIVAVVCCLLLLVIGFVGTSKVKEYRNSSVAEERVWDECVKKDTYIEYAKYIVSYPEGQHNKAALERMEQLKNEKGETTIE